MRDERGQTATEFLGMLLIVAAIVFALASPKFTQPIRDAFRGQTEAVATEGEDGGKTKRTTAARDRRARPTPTPTPASGTPATGTRTQQLSRRLNALEKELRTSKLPERSTEYQQIQLERNQVAAAYAEARRRERRRTGSGERG